jgi:hypothetical protein
VKTQITLIQKKLEDYERKFDSMEKSWNKNEVILEGILNTLIEFNSSKNSSNT